MKILGIIHKNSAVCYHRIAMPLLLMPDVDCHITNHVTEETFDAGYDLVFYSRVLNDVAMQGLYKMRAKHGFKLVCDVDDYWHLDYWHPMHKEYEETNFAYRQVQSIINADMVLVTHERLLAEVQPFNSNVHIVYNAIPQIEQYLTERVPFEQVRLFWQGSVTHHEDLKLIQYTIENILHNKLRHEIMMIMAGFHKEMQEWLDMANIFTANGKLSHKLITGMTPDTYYKAYAYADVCLIPLVASRFNGFKSNLKVLEAGNLALPVIAPNVHPYKDLPVMYAQGSNDWLEKIKWYVRNEQARKEDGERLQEFCSMFFSYRKINEMRKQIFEYECKKVSV